MGYFLDYEHHTSCHRCGRTTCNGNCELTHRHEPEMNVARGIKDTVSALPSIAEQLASASIRPALYVFVVTTTDRELVGVFGARDDADAAAKAYLNEPIGGECKQNFQRDEFWSWYNRNGEVTVEMTKLQ